MIDLRAFPSSISTNRKYQRYSGATPLGLNENPNLTQGRPQKRANPGLSYTTPLGFAEAIEELLRLSGEALGRQR